jgi:hypothetical protein
VVILSSHDIRAISSDISRFFAPSSMAGIMWQCRSINAAPAKFQIRRDCSVRLSATSSTGLDGELVADQQNWAGDVNLKFLRRTDVNCFHTPNYPPF